MKPLYLLGIFVLFWALIHFWLLRFVEKLWSAGDLRKKILHASTLTLLHRVRDLCGVGAVTVMLLMIVIWVLSFFSESTAVLPKLMLDSLSSLYSITKNVAVHYNTFLIWFGVLGAAAALYLTARTAKKRVTAAWMAKAQEVQTRLQENREELHALRDDAQLHEIVERLVALLEIRENIDEEELDADQSDNLQTEIQLLFNAIVVEKSKRELNVEKALRTSSQPKSDELDASKSIVLRIFASDRLAKDLGFINRPLSFLITSLLIISLTGWVATPLANSLRVTVNNLRIQLEHSVVDRDLDEEITRVPVPEPNEDSNDDDDRITNETTNIVRASSLLVQATIQELNRSALLERSVGIKPFRQNRSEFVRAAILEQPRKWNNPNSPSSKIVRQVDEAIANDSTSTGPNKHLQEKIESLTKPKVEALQKRNPQAVNSLFHWLDARYGRAKNPLNAQSSLISSMLSHSFEAIDLKMNGELFKQGRNIADDVGKSAVQTWTIARAKALMMDGILQHAEPEVLNSLRGNVEFEVSSRTSELIKDIRKIQGAGWKPPKAEIRNQDMGNRLGKALHEASDADRTNRLVSVLRKAEISDRDAAYSLFKALSEASSRSSSVEISQQLKGYSAIFARGKELATNFAMASRSFRARGVILGRNVTSNTDNVTGIDWTIDKINGRSPTMLSLSLVIGGKHVSLGRFPAGIVNQALKYAADGRVVATTIMRGAAIIKRVTHLHPALEDTPLGCRVIEADRFVDTFTAPIGDGYDSRLKHIKQHRAALTFFLLIADLAEQISGNAGNCHKSQLKSLAEKLDFFTFLIFSDNKKRIRKLSDDPNGKKNEQFSSAPDLQDMLVAYRSRRLLADQNFRNHLKHFIDTELDEQKASSAFVKTVYKCAIGNSMEIAHCLCRSLASNPLPTKYWFPVDHTSQFREKEKTLDAALGLRVQSGNLFENFEMWLHTTFAVRNRNDKNDDESTATPMNFPRSQIRVLNDVLSNDLIPAYIKNTLKFEKYDDFMKPLADFVVLQRLMRAALNGKLGDDFPLEKLIELERVTRKFVPYQATMRWELNEKMSPDQFEKFLSKRVGPGASKVFVDYRNDRKERLKDKKPLCATASL